MARTRLFVFAYDISSSSRRHAMAKALEKEGVRVQRSVFEVRVTHDKAQVLAREVKRYLEKGDNLRIYHVPNAAMRYCETHGGAPLPQPGDWLIF